jgi:hypothetical protein
MGRVWIEPTTLGLKVRQRRIRRAATSCSGAEILHVVGRLEAAGNVVSLEFPATIRPIGDEFEVEATVTVDHSQLGMSSGQLGMIRRPTTLHVKARLS